MITQRFGRGVKIVFIEYIIVAITGLLFFALLGRIISFEEIGIFSIITFTITILATLIEFSAGTIASQLIGSARGEKNTDQVPGIVRSSLRMVLSFALIAFSIALCFVIFWQIMIFDFLFTLIVILVPVIGGIRMLYFGFLLGLEKFGIKSVLAVTVFVLPKVLGLGLVIFLNTGLWGLVVSLLIGELLTLSLCVIFGGVPVLSDTNVPIRQIFGLGVALSVILLLVRLFDYVDRLVIFFRAGDLFALGAYDLSIRLLAPLFSLTIVITSVSLPILSYTIKEDSESKHEYISTLLRFYLVIFAPFFMFLAVTINGQLPQLIYGATYPLLGTIFSVLVIASLFQGLLLLGISLLQAIGERTSFILLGVPVIILDVIFTWLLLPVLGGYGIAIMRLVSYVFASLLLLYILWKKAQPSLELKWTLKLVGLLLIVVLPILIMNLLSWSLWILFLVEAFLAFSLFVLSIRFLRIIEEKDRTRLAATFPFLAPFIRLFRGD